MKTHGSASINATALPALPDGWRWMPLGELCKQERRAASANSATAQRLPYLSLENIESGTGRLIALGQEENGGRSTTFLFDSRHVLYGKLRPYLNKVALPDAEGRCTTELIPLLPQGVDRVWLAWLLRRQETVDAAMRDKTGSRMPRANMDNLLRLLVPLPPLEEQQRIAAALDEQMATIGRARSAAEAQLQIAKTLPAVYLHSIFSRPEVGTWPRRRLSEVAELLPAKSIATAGDIEVRVVTTACLTEAGFDPAGIKTARMWSDDAADCVISGGEVLIARSNTPELVGRVAMYPGNHGGVVASDLTIRILPKDTITSAFLSAYLSFLFVSGYWTERAGGASGSMKKITRSQIQGESVPVPPLSEQQAIVDRLHEKITDTANLRIALITQLDTITRLPAILLRQAFSGELRV